MGDIEELIDLVLTGQHPRLRERCFVYRIVSVLEDTFGAYDAAGVRAVLMDRRDEVDAALAEAGAAPPSFLSLLVTNVTEHAAGGECSSAAASSAASSAATSSAAAPSSAAGSAAAADSSLAEKPNASTRTLA
jgi:hypothetical protein